MATGSLYTDYWGIVNEILWWAQKKVNEDKDQVLLASVYTPV